MTKKARRAAALVLALLLVLAGVLLLRRGTDRDGVRVESLVLDGVPFRLYRLGEGSGCPIAMMMLDAACTVMNDMATFEQAGIDSEYLDPIRKTDSFTVK